MSRTLSRFARYWLPPIALMGLIFFLSAQPKTDMPDWGTMDAFLKKATHVAVYGLLYLLLFRAFRGEWPTRTAGGRGVYLPVFIAILYGASDEWHQTFVPGREGTLRDVLINAVGVFLAHYAVRRRPQWFRAVRPAPKSQIRNPKS